MTKFLDCNVSDEFLSETPVRKMGSPSGYKIVLGTPGDHYSEEVKTPIVEHSRFTAKAPFGNQVPFRDGNVQQMPSFFILKNKPGVDSHF